MDNHLFLGHDKLEVLAHHFRVVDTHGAMLFAVNKNEVSIGANTLNVEGEGGAIFRESIQTPFIKAEPGHELKCVSAAYHICPVRNNMFKLVLIHAIFLQFQFN